MGEPENYSGGRYLDESSSSPHVLVWTGDGRESKFDECSVSDISEDILSQEQLVSEVSEDDILYTGGGCLFKVCGLKVCLSEAFS